MIQVFPIINGKRQKVLVAPKMLKVLQFFDKLISKKEQIKLQESGYKTLVKSIKEYASLCNTQKPEQSLK